MMTQPGTNVYFRLEEGGSKRCCPSLTLTRVILLVAASLLLISAAFYFPAMAEVSDNFSVQDYASIASSITKFAATLFQSVAKQAGSDSNILISPFSVAAVATMAYVGARGNTAEQMKNVLHFSMDDEKINSLMGKLIQSAKGDENCTLESANQMYVAEKYQLLDAFQAVLKDHFGAEAQAVDFASDDTRTKINKWVEEFTHDKIQDLLPKGSLTSLTKLALVNAVYFKGKWMRQFVSARTQVQPFYLGSEDKKIDAQIMHDEADYRIGELFDHDARILEIPYRGKKLSMFIVLPNKVDGLAELESKLVSHNVLEAMYVNMWTAKMKIAIPKFTIQTELQLSETFKQLGMADLFDEKAADLSGISGKKDLVVSDVFHKTFIEVNEEGTEAAAATGMVMMTRMMIVEPPRPFIADHPFLYLIRDNSSKMVLFTGRVANPSQK